jgi:hypothetical protein
MSDDTSSKQKCVITLVHGTFARDADWANDPQSPLRRRLTEKLDDVDFKIFKWTGGNSDVDRIDGAKELQGAIRCVATESPDARHIIIGHSHGGNVILRALDGFSEAGHVDRVVTLATPFINCKARELNRLVKVLRGGSTALLAALALLVVWMSIPIAKSLEAIVPLGNPDESDPWGTWQTIVVCLDLLLGLLAATYLWLKVFAKTGPVFARAKAKQEKIMAEHDHPGEVTVPFLSVSTNFDEAAIILGGASRFAEFVAWFDWILKPIVYLLWISIIGFAYLAANSDGWDEDRYLFIFITAILILMQLPLALLRTAIRGAGAGFRGLIRSLIFGSGGITKNSLVEFWTTKAPTGVKNAKVCSLAVDVNMTGMRHSAVYTTPTILDKIADWIDSSIETSRSE